MRSALPLGVRTAVALAALFLGSCSSVNVTTDYTEDSDFSVYRTFDWMPGPQGLSSSFTVGPTMDNRIRRAVESELVVRGLQHARVAEKPDLFVVYHAAMNQDFDKTYYDVWGYGRRGRFRHGAVVVVDRQSQGTFVIDLVDAGSNQLVWRGAASGVVSSPEEARKRVFEAISRILEGYPPS